MVAEFDLIQRYFSRPTPSAVLGIGDDAALLTPAADMQLVVSSDMLVAGTHFFADTDPRKLGWKTLAVNVSDLAAMGAQPRWATLALALPEIDDDWLAAFAAGLFEAADQFGVELVGGDTTRGPLNLSLTIFGEVPAQHALRRDAAEAGDDVWVSGTLGGAALGLAALQNRVQLTATDYARCLHALEAPQPRLALGLSLRGIAHAAIDISDGLLADLGHILRASNLGAHLHFEQLPLAAELLPFITHDWARQCLLAGGDDYELCFSASPQQREAINRIARRCQLSLTRIGQLKAEAGLHLLDSLGEPMPISHNGFEHFADDRQPGA